MEFEINLFTFIFGTLIFGLGYVGLFLRKVILKQILPSSKKKDFYDIGIFDKIIQSIVLGTMSFLIAIKTGFVEFPIYSKEEELLQYIIINPEIFFFQAFILMMVVIMLISLEMFFKTIFNLK